MTQTSTSSSTSKAVVSLLVSGSLYVAVGFVVSLAANGLSPSLLQALSAWCLHHREMASSAIGWTIAAYLGVTAVLFGLSFFSARSDNPWVVLLSRAGRWATDRLMSRAVKATCFLCGALAGFGGMGWLAAALMLLMYVGIFVALQGLVIGAQMRPHQ